MATHSSVLAWRIPGTGEPGGLPSMGSQSRTRLKRLSSIQSCCGEGGTLQTNITGVCGECSQCLGHTGFAPAHGGCAFPVYIAQFPGCSAGEPSEAGPGLCGLSRSKPLRFRFLGIAQRHRLGWACILCPSQVRAVQATRCLVSAVSPRWGVHLITSPVPAAGFSGCLQVHLLRCAVCLFWGADLWLRPSRRMSTVQNPKKSWLATKPVCSLVDNASLGPQLPPYGSGCLSPEGDGL